MDVRGNLIWRWVGYGTLIWEGAWANVASNYYGTSSKAVQVIDARAWVQGNRAADGGDVDGVGTETVPFDAVPVDVGDACDAALAALAGAGVRPLDPSDASRLSTVQLAGCGSEQAVQIAEEPHVTLPIPTSTSALESPVVHEVAVAVPVGGHDR